MTRLESVGRELRPESWHWLEEWLDLPYPPREEVLDMVTHTIIGRHLRTVEEWGIRNVIWRETQ